MTPASVAAVAVTHPTPEHARPWIDELLHQHAAHAANLRLHVQVRTPRVTHLFATSEPADTREARGGVAADLTALRDLVTRTNDAIDAVGRYQLTHGGDAPARALTVEAPPPVAGALVALGELHALSYYTQKGGETAAVYEHTFGEETGERPFLAVDAAGRLHIIGGVYLVTERGIEG
jgi:hypothetical protein